MYQQSGNEKNNHGKNGCVHAESRSVKEEWQGVEIVTDGTHICNILVKGWHRALLNLCAFLLILEISVSISFVGVQERGVLYTVYRWYM